MNVKCQTYKHTYTKIFHTYYLIIYFQQLSLEDIKANRNSQNVKNINPQG